MVYSECLTPQYPVQDIEALSPSDSMIQSFEWISPTYKGIRNKKKWVNDIPGIPNPAIRSTSGFNHNTYKPRNTALLATCHQIHAEAAHVLYGKNVFGIWVTMRPGKTGHLEEARIYPEHASLIRHMRITPCLEHKEYTESTMATFKELMSAVHESILPLCPSLVELRWLIAAGHPDFYEEELWL